MLLRNKGQVELRCPRRWKWVIAGGLTAFAVAAAGVYVSAAVGASRPTGQEEIFQTAREARVHSRLD